VDKACSVLKQKLDPPMAHNMQHSSSLYVDTQHRLLLCLPPKCGGTTWKTIICNNTSKDPLQADFMGNLSYVSSKTMASFNITHFEQYSSQQQFEILHSFYKIMVTRHPLERLVSGYVDKLTHVNPFYLIIGAPLLHKYHPELPDKVKKKGAGVVFRDFIQAVVDGEHNRHWMPVSQLCFPCHIKYDKIVKLETQEIDADEVIGRHLGPYFRGVETRQNKKREGAGSINCNGKVLHQFKNVTRDVFDSLLAQGWADEMAMFGYSYGFNDDNGLVAYCQSGSSETGCC
jgi:hypothetical protein